MSQPILRAHAGGRADAHDPQAAAVGDAAINEAGLAAAAALDARLASISDLDGRLSAIADAIPGRIAFSTSLGLEDQAVVHAIIQSGRAFDVFTLDTGRHFPETLETLEAIENVYDYKVRVVFPDADDVEMLVARDGIMGFRHSVEARKACCHVRKVLPLNKALAGASGWITGLRREQSSERSHVPFAAWDAEHQLIKINPIADWSLEALEAFIAANGIPVNALHARGFPSIGCQPCTRAIRPGEDIRAGRWWWENQDGKECGLHNSPKAKETQA
jgi:phosphoadenosine phosphosulfate reductase